MSKPDLRPKKKNIIMSPEELVLYKKDIAGEKKSRKEIERKFRTSRRIKV